MKKSTKKQNQETLNLDEKSEFIGSHNIYLKELRKLKNYDSKKESEIIEQLKTPDLSKERKKYLRDELVKMNLRFVLKTAKKYQRVGIALEDLIAEGNVALIKAAERFDPVSNNVKFITYAIFWIKQGMLEVIYNLSRNIRIPANIMQDAKKVEKDFNKNSLYNNYTRNNERFEDAALIPYTISLDQIIGDEGETYMNVLPDLNAKSTDHLLETNDEIKHKVMKMLSILDNREKYIIEQSFGLTGGGEINLEEIGKELDCSKERVRQIRDRAIKKLRNDSFDLLKYL